MITINNELSEERDTDYPPLTDKQKEAMSDADIKAWEDKAKSGLLRNDDVLENIASKMRQTLYSSIADVSGTLYSIGIKTGTWDQKGKLVIDETKLRSAISNTPDVVMNVFTKESSIAYSPNLTSAQRTDRFNQSGIIARLSDVLNDNIRTSRDSNNNKGILLEKAGLVGDVTEYDNSMYDSIKLKDDYISDLIDRLNAKEDAYYKQFSAMETAINQMNSQSAWLSQQMGG